MPSIPGSVTINDAGDAHADAVNPDSSSAEITGILDTIDVPIVVVGRDCKVGRFNRAATKTLGLTPSDVGRLSRDVGVLKDVKHLEKLCAQVIADGEQCQRDIRNGDKWFLLRIAPYTGSGGRTGAVLTFTNVTALRASIAQAVYEREFTKAILNTVIEPLVVLDANLLVQTGNRAFYSMFGVSREVQGVPFYNLGNDDWKTSGLWQSLKAIISDNTEFQTIEIERDFALMGRRTVLVDARRLSREGDPLLLVVLRDITERKRAEEKLRDAEQQLRDFVENATVGMHWVGPDGIVLWANRTELEMLGYTSEEYIGHHIAEFHADRPVIEDILQRLTIRETLWEYEARLRCKDGSIRDVLINSNVLWEEDKFIHTRCFTRDITERKRAEAQLQDLMNREREARAAAEASNRIKDEFLALVSHELRTPLSAIVGWTQLLKNGKLDERDSERAIQTIDRNAKAQATIINELLDMSRIISGKVKLDRQPIDLAGVINAAIDVVRPAADAKDIEIVSIAEPDVGLVLGDSVRLQQVAWNLLSNAVKFTPKRGRVEVELKRMGTEIVIVVMDTGAGISPDFLPHIFERFQQADTSEKRVHGGLGLGLSIVRHLVEMHGGSVRAESEGEGRGTTFVVTLPVLAVSGVTSSNPESQLADSEPRSSDSRHWNNDRAAGQPALDLRSDILSGLKVLAIDDQPDTRDLIIVALTRYGAEVKACTSATEALKTIQEWKPQVIVSDIGMPDEDGYDLMRKVRALDADGVGGIPAVALTGYAGAENESKARSAGYQVHIAKPVELRELITTIAKLSQRECR
jgi:PAS domain S-box-containing protein